MELIGVDAMGHRHPSNRCPWSIAGFYCPLLEFEAVSPSCSHIVSAKKLADTSKRSPSKLLRSKTSRPDGHGQTVMARRSWPDGYVATLAKDSVQNTDQEVIVGHHIQTRR